MREVPLEGGSVQLMGSLDLDRSPEGITPRRLPDWTRMQVSPFMEQVLLQPSGVRLEFMTTSRVIELEAMVTGMQTAGRAAGEAIFDLEIDDGPELRSQAVTPGGRLMVNSANRGESEQTPGEPSRLRFEGLPAGVKRCALWLPQGMIVELRALRIDDDAGLEATPTPPRRRWVHYGSSISHCSGAHSPARTWPAVGARLAGVDLLNLGVGGNCHLDQFVARTIRDAQADVISLKVGINILNIDSLKDRTFTPVLHGFLDTIRDGKPNTPILVASPIICPPAEDHPGPTVAGEDGRFITIPGHDEVREGSITLRRMRSTISRIVEKRCAAGDQNLHYLNGLELFGEPDVDDLPDALHPNGDGYIRIGERFAKLAFGPGGPLAG